MLPADMGGRGRILHLLSKAAMPNRLEAQLLNMDSSPARTSIASLIFL